MSNLQNHDAALDSNKDANGIMATSFFVADGVRFLVELLVYGIAMSAAGAAFVPLWQLDQAVWRIVAFPAAYGGLIFGFYIALLLVRIVFLRKVRPGAYPLSDRGALRWIVADSIMRMVERSFLRGYLKEFAIQRFIFYRAMGAKVDTTFMIGWDVRILDPWLLEVGPNSLIGSFVVISGHAVEGDTVSLDPVRIGADVTVGMRAIIMPGVEIGDGAIIGAGALVSKGKKVPPGEIWAGIPAKKIGTVGQP
jgi:acetyltransferase-like isoleucine patch superfamily enzyme